MKQYTIDVGGLPHTFLFSDEEAKARGLTADESKAAPKSVPAPKNKARKAVDKKD